MVPNSALEPDVNGADMNHDMTKDESCGPELETGISHPLDNDIANHSNAVLLVQLICCSVLHSGLAYYRCLKWPTLQLDIS